jgi:outer membrane biosynthesis protein TonB
MFGGVAFQHSAFRRPSFLHRILARTLAPRWSNAKLIHARETLLSMPSPEKPQVPNEEPPEKAPPVTDPPDPKTDPTAINLDDAQIEPPKGDAFRK